MIIKIIMMMIIISIVLIVLRSLLFITMQLSCDIHSNTPAQSIILYPFLIKYVLQTGLGMGMGMNGTAQQPWYVNHRYRVRLSA